MADAEQSKSYLQRLSASFRNAMGSPEDEEESPDLDGKKKKKKLETTPVPTPNEDTTGMSLSDIISKKTRKIQERNPYKKED